MKQTPPPKSPDSDVIDALGGATAVAKLLGLGPHGPQRVHNWRSRGIPAKVKLERPDIFLRRARAARPAEINAAA